MISAHCIYVIICRWGLMTITTVGYELNPKTLLGKLIGGFCALSGIFILTLPIPIVVNRWPDVQTLIALYCCPQLRGVLQEPVVA